MVITDLSRLQMIRTLNTAVGMIALFLFSANTFAAPAKDICMELGGYLTNNYEFKLPNPAREPSKFEKNIIQKSNIESLRARGPLSEDAGVSIIDVDNDGVDDLIAWSVQGSGKFVYVDVYDYSVFQYKIKFTPKASMQLGHGHGPEYIIYKGVNYIVSSNAGDEEDLSVSKLIKLTNGKYLHQKVCRMKAAVIAETICRHPACKKLKEVIDKKADNDLFVDVAKPHFYKGHAGLSIYFPENGSYGDFDNSKNPISIWRFGRDEYHYQYIYWSLLGQGDEMPDVDPRLRPIFDDVTPKRVLPGRSHDRLRRTLAQQSEVLSRELNRNISLPNDGQFFLFNAHENRTYWAWDFGDPPYGKEIHIAYTNVKKSDYIGMVRLKRRLSLEPCSERCLEPLFMND
jgi:hypothetical protein